MALSGFCVDVWALRMKMTKRGPSLGSCPGTSWIQAGANVANWSYVLFGGFWGDDLLWRG